MKKFISISAILAALVSTPIWAFIGINYWVAFASIFCILISIWICFLVVIKTQYRFKIEKLRSEEFLQALKQTVRCKCAYCKTDNDQLINLQKSTQSFKCKKCDKTNRIIFNFEVAQISDSHNI